MTTLVTTARLIVAGQTYECCIDAGYTWRRPIPPSITGPGEGGVELEYYHITAAYDDDGEVVEDEEVLGELEGMVYQQALYWECVADHEARCTAAKELWAEMRSGT